MGELSKWDLFTSWVIETFYSCKFFGHRFKFKPLPGDKPPYEFEVCKICFQHNPRFKEKNE